MEPRLADRLRLPPLLLVLGAAVIVANNLWLSVDRRPFAWDESIHYMGAVGYYRTLQASGPGTVRAILYQSDFYPPLQELLAGTLFLVTGPSPKISAALNILYLLLILWLLFLLGRRLFDADVGILAGFLFAASSAVVIQSKFLMLDIPLVFWVLLAFYCFVRSESFARRPWALAYGLAFGLALLTKWSALFFLALPPLIAAFSAHAAKSRAAGAIWFNVLLAYLLAGLLAAPWYLVHLAQFARHSSGYVYQRGVLENDPPLLSPGSWFYYLGGLFRQMSWPLALLTLAGLAYFLPARRHLSLWAIWLGLPYLLLTLIRNKDLRYTLPLLPFFALAGLAWLQKVPASNRKRLQYALAVLMLLQMAYVHLGAYAGPVHAWLSRPVLGEAPVKAQGPDSAVWPIGQILEDVHQAAAQGARKPVLRVIPDDSCFARVTFSVEQSRRPGASVFLSGSTDWPAFTDFAVTKTGSLGLPFMEANLRRLSAELMDGNSETGRRFALHKRYALPDKSEALLYIRKPLKDSGPPAKILDELHQRLTQLLLRYVRDAKNLSLEIIPISAEHTLEGRFQSVRIRAQSARVGDFAHNSLGVTLNNLDLELSGLALDLDQARKDKLVPYELEEIAINHLEIDAATLNQSLAEAEGDVRRLRAAFMPDLLRLDWTGKPAVRVEAALTVVSDPRSPGSDNLRLDFRHLRVAGMGIPGYFIQPLVEDFNPLFKLAGMPIRLRLGRLRLETGRLILGRKEEKSGKAEGEACMERRAGL